MSKTIILFIFLPGYEIRAVDDPGPIRMDRVTDGRSGCSRQGAARQAANNRGAVRQVRFYDFTPAGEISDRGDFHFRGNFSESSFCFCGA